MPDEISMAGGVAEMAYVGDVPWHKLGNQLEKGASKKAWRKAAGYEWEILRAPVNYTPEGFGKRFTLDNREVLYRSDTGAGLSTVSKKFKIVQPSTIMDYFDDLVQNAGFQLETAGVLFGGRRLWALANIGEESYIADPRDKVKGRLLLATSVDGTLATTLKFICERVVCNNTLTWGLAEKDGTTVKVRHNTEFRPEIVNDQLGIRAHGGFQETVNSLRRLAETPMTDNQMIAATVALVAPKVAEAEFIDTLNSRDVQRIGELAIEGRAIGAELDGSRGTAWGWLNSVTQYVDHESAARTDDTKLSSCWFGKGERMKTRAWDICEMIVEHRNGGTELVQQFVGNTDADLLNQILANA